MSSEFRTAEDYELFVYSLPERYPSIRNSTITFVRLGTTLARIAGELFFDHGIRAIIRERFVYDRLPGLLDWYGYEVWLNDEKLYWYDPQPHPNDPELQTTHPHHKHVPPDLKHHRVPAPDLDFSRPNLPFIIEEIEQLVQAFSASSSIE